MLHFNRVFLTVILIDATQSVRVQLVRGKKPFPHRPHLAIKNRQGNITHRWYVVPSLGVEDELREKASWRSVWSGWCRWDLAVLCVGWYSWDSVCIRWGSVQDWLQIPVPFLCLVPSWRVSSKLLNFSLLDNPEVLIVLMVISTAIVLTVIVLRCRFSSTEVSCRLAIHPWPIPTHEAGRRVGQLKYVHHIYS